MVVQGIDEMLTVGDEASKVTNGKNAKNKKYNLE